MELKELNREYINGIWRINKMRENRITNIVILMLGNLVLFLNVILKTRSLTVEFIGEIVLVQTIASTIFLFTNFGLSNVVLKFYKNDIEGKKILIEIFLINILFFLISVVVFKYFIFKQFKEYKLINFTYVLLFSNYLSNYFNSVNIARGKMTSNNIVSKLFLPIVNTVQYILLYNNIISDELFYILFFFSALIPIIVYIVMNSDIFKIKFLSGRLILNKNHIMYSKYFFLSGLAFSLINKIDIYFLKYYYSSIEVGKYSIILPFSSLILLVTVAFGQPLYSKVNILLENGDLKELSKLYKKNAKEQLYFSLIIFLGISCYFIPFFKIVNKQYIYIYTPLIILSIGRLIDVSTGMCGTILNFSKYYKYDIRFTILLLMLSIVTNIILIPKYSINGAVIATAVSLGIYNLLKVYYVYKTFKIIPFDVESLKIMSMGVILIILNKILIINIGIINVIELIISIMLSIICFDLILGRLILKKYSFIWLLIRRIYGRVSKNI